MTKKTHILLWFTLELIRIGQMKSKAKCRESSECTVLQKRNTSGPITTSENALTFEKLAISINFSKSYNRTRT